MIMCCDLTSGRVQGGAQRWYISDVRDILPRLPCGRKATNRQEMVVDILYHQLHNRDVSSISYV